MDGPISHVSQKLTQNGPQRPRTTRRKQTVHTSRYRQDLDKASEVQETKAHSKMGFDQAKFR